MTRRVLSIGHSTRSAEELLSLLRAHEIELLADVRRFPGSRRQPQFGVEALSCTLADAGIGYVLLPSLGGRRTVSPGSRNGGWRNRSFQGYADHLASAEFAEGLTALLGLAHVANTCIMCAEALPWRCHRWLIADVLTLQGVAVAHILGAGPARPHTLSAFARVEGGRLFYPADANE